MTYALRGYFNVKSKPAPLPERMPLRPQPNLGSLVTPSSPLLPVVTLSPKQRNWRSIEPREELVGASLNKGQRHSKCYIQLLAVATLVAQFFAMLYAHLRKCLPQLPIERLQEQLRQEYADLSPKVEQLKSDIKHFDDFVFKHPELLRIFKQRYEENREFITRVLDDPPSLDGEDQIAELRKLGDSYVIAKSELHQRIWLVSINPDLLRSFKEHLEREKGEGGQEASGMLRLIDAHKLHENQTVE